MCLCLPPHHALCAELRYGTFAQIRLQLAKEFVQDLSFVAGDNEALRQRVQQKGQPAGGVATADSSSSNGAAAAAADGNGNGQPAAAKLTGRRAEEAARMQVVGQARHLFANQRLSFAITADCLSQSHSKGALHVRFCR